MSKTHCSACGAPKEYDDWRFCIRCAKEPGWCKLCGERPIEKDDICNSCMHLGGTAITDWIIYQRERG